MPLISWSPAVIFLIYLSAFTLAADENFLERSTTLQQQEMVFDHQPLKDNNLVFGGCEVSQPRRDMNCTLYLESFSTNNEHQLRKCVVNYQVEGIREIDHEFQLKLMFEDRVVFAWLDKPENDRDIYQLQQLVFYTVNMHRCTHTETKIKIPHKREATSIDDFFFVPYHDTFDVFYANKRLCKDKVCGRTHNKDGLLINGPVPSYVPAEFLNANVAAFVPVRNKSPAMGHFLLSEKFRLISSRYGQVKEVMDLPRDIEGQTFSSEHGYMSYCYVSRYQPSHVNCSRFDIHGEPSSSIIELDYTAGRWLAVHSLSDQAHRFLLLVSECNEHSWCAENVDQVPFHVYLVSRDGSYRELFNFRGVKCISGLDVVASLKTIVRRERDGSVRVNAACLEGDAEGGKMKAAVHLTSRRIVDVDI